MRCFRSRMPWFESLESRCLLDGTLSVEFLHGDLFITGDDENNVFTVELVQNDSSGHNVRIVPDVTTSVNELRPGEPMSGRVDGDVWIDLRGGDDHLLVLGAADQSLAALMIDTPSGNDRITLRHLELSSELRITRDETPESSGVGSGNPMIRLTEMTAAAIYLKIDGIDGESSRSSSVVMDQVAAKGRLELVASGSADVQATQLRARNAYLKIEGVEGESTRSSSMELDHVTTTGRLELLASGNIDVVAHQLQAADAFLKIEGVEGESTRSSSVVLTDVAAHGRLEVLAPGGTDVRASQLRAADAFLKIEGVEGESTRSSSVVLTDVASQGRFQLVSGGPTNLRGTQIRAGNAYFEIGGIHGDPTRSSIVLRAVYTDRRLDLVTSEDTEMHVCELKGLDVSVNIHARPDDDPPPTGLGPTIGVSPHALENVTASRRFHIVGHSGADLWLGAIKAKHIFIKIDDIEGETQSPTHLMLKDSRIEGRLDLLTGPSDDFVQFTRVQVGGPTVMDMGSGDDHLVLEDSYFADLAELHGGPGFDVLELYGTRFELEPLLSGWERVLEGSSPFSDDDDDT